MKLKLLPLLALALLPLAFPTRVSLASEGAIEGAIINKTTGQPVSGQLVLLHVTPPDGKAPPDMEATSGPEGRFSFQGVQLASGTQLALCATYLDAMYHDTFEAPADGAAVSRDVAVYDTTDVDDAITMQSTHVVFYPNAQQSVVEVQEFAMFQNTGNRTYVGAKEGGVGNPGETLHFTFPQGAARPTLSHGLTEDQVQWHDSGFCSLAPIIPGDQDVMYSYTLPFSGKGSLRFSKPLGYHPAELVAMTYGNQGQVAGAGVTAQGAVDVEGTQYGVYRVSLSQDQTALDLELTGLGGGGPAAKNLGTFKVLAGVLAAVGLAGTLYYALVLKRRRQQLAPVAVTSDDSYEEEDGDGQA